MLRKVMLGLGLVLASAGCSSSQSAKDPPHPGMEAGGGSSGSAGAGGQATAGVSGMAANGGSNDPFDAACKPAKSVDAQANPAAVVLAGVKGMESLIPKIQYVYAVGDNVFYDDPTGVHRVAKAGGTPELVYDNTGYPQTIAGTNSLFFLSAGSILALPLTGTAVMPTTIASNLNADAPNDRLIRADATSVYLWLRATGNVERVDIASGAVNTVATGTFDVNWTFYGDQFYYGDTNDQVYSVNLDGTGQKNVGQADEIDWTLAADASHVYVGGYTMVFVLRKTQSDPFSVLLSTNGYVDRLEVEGDHLVYGGGGNIGTVSLDGTKCTAVGSVSERWDWAYDDKFFYYSQGAALYKVPK